MKKIFAILCLSLILMTGCSTSMGTPTAAVEKYLSKYQNLDSEILTQLDSVISNDASMSDDQKKEYKELMINQYKNLSYKVVNENVMGDEAEVEVEIEVLDYASNITSSKSYYNNHKDEFKDKEKKNDDDNKKEDNNENEGLIEEGSEMIEDAVDNISSFIDYKIKNLKEVKSTTSYTITFKLTKDDNNWKVEDISDVDMQKLHGLYEGK